MTGPITTRHLAELMDAGRRPDQMLWDLMLKGMQAAADIFRFRFTKPTAGSDGFVSIEVGPAIAGDTNLTTLSSYTAVPPDRM